MRENSQALVLIATKKGEINELQENLRYLYIDFQ